jgi:hypothetical protein
VEAEDLHAWLRVRVVGRLETQLLDATLLEELFNNSHHVAKCQFVVSDESFNLMELCKVGCIQRLVAEHSIDGEILGRLEHLLLRELVEHSGGDAGCVGSHDVLCRFLLLPIILVPLRSVSADRVDSFDAFQVIHRELVRLGRIGDKERVVSIARRMLLRLEKRVEIPETALDKIVCRHLSEPHLEEDLSELCPNFEQGVQVTTFGHLATRVKVESFKLFLLPQPTRNHVSCQVRFLFFDTCCEAWSFRHDVVRYFLFADEIAFLAVFLLIVGHRVKLQITNLLTYLLHNVVYCVHLALNFLLPALSLDQFDPSRGLRFAETNLGIRTCLLQ